MDNTASLPEHTYAVTNPVIKPYSIKRMGLEGFRNIASYHCDNLQDPFIAIIGNNGVGKTNMLEAVSLLQVGKGLRRANYKDMATKGVPTYKPWRISYNACVDGMDYNVHISLDNDKKTIAHDGVPVKNDFLDNLGSIFWATPHYDRILSESQSARRNFLDRLISLFHKDHTKNLKRLEHALRERTKIVAMHHDKTWREGVEETIISLSSLIAVTRLHYNDRINNYLQHYDAVSFLPKCTYSLDGFFEHHLRDKSALEVENLYRHYLGTMTTQETLDKGVHRTYIYMHYDAKDMDAVFCSTGEQKLLMLTLICASICMYIDIKKQYPIILLDEITAHLDSAKRYKLFMFLHRLGCQCWVTGTDKEHFSMLKNYATFFHL